MEWRPISNRRQGGPRSTWKQEVEKELGRIEVKALKRKPGTVKLAVSKVRISSEIKKL